MPIEYVSGDLLLNRYNAQALAHGCNCQGSMGAGIAVGFRAQYPDMYEEYRRRCKVRPREFNLGDAFLWKESDKPCVFNLGTQEDTYQSLATYEAVEQALRTMRAVADSERISTIAVPKIGAGLGGLSWEGVQEVVERVFAEWPGTLYVYEKYLQGQ